MRRTARQAALEEAGIDRWPLPVLVTCLLALTLACADENGGREGAFYRIEMRGHPATEAFVVHLTDPVMIEWAESELSRPIGERMLHPNGRLAAGAGGFNAPWSWHLVPEHTGLYQISIEVCDGKPSMIEEDLEYWLRLGQFCPWSGYVSARL